MAKKKEKAVDPLTAALRVAKVLGWSYRQLQIEETEAKCKRDFEKWREKHGIKKL